MQIMKMTFDNKHVRAFRQIGMTILLLAFTSLTVLSQVTKQQLDDLYKNNQEKELEQIFINLYQQTQTDFYKLSSNDTLKKINDIFNLILPEIQNTEDKRYFFLQSYFPKTFIDKNKLTFPNDFNAKSTCANLKPIRYDGQTINAILNFIGSHPYDNPTVKEYVKDKEKMKKSKLKEAERLIADYNNKTKFIRKFLYLPATWGKMDRSLVPYKINRLKFNTDLTELEIEYDLTWRGATDIFKFVGGKWIKVRTEMEWIH
jgi:hypothetical protein